MAVDYENIDLSAVDDMTLDEYMAYLRKKYGLVEQPEQQEVPVQASTGYENSQDVVRDFSKYDIERTEANNYGFNPSFGAAGQYAASGAGLVSGVPGMGLLAAGLQSTNSKAVNSAYRDVFGQDRPVSTHLKGVFGAADSSGFISEISAGGQTYTVTLAPNPDDPTQITPARAKELLGSGAVEVGPVADARQGFVQKAFDGAKKYAAAANLAAGVEVPSTEEMAAAGSAAVDSAKSFLSALPGVSFESAPAAEPKPVSFMDYAGVPRADQPAPGAGAAPSSVPLGAQYADTPSFARDVFAYDESGRRGFSPENTSLDYLSPDVVQRLDRVRDQFGVERLDVTSAFRSPNYNAAVGGARSSQHMNGLAVDVRIPEGVDAVAFADTLAAAGFQGIGIGSGYLHADLRPTATTWTYPGVDPAVVKSVRSTLGARYDANSGRFTEAPSTYVSAPTPQEKPTSALTDLDAPYRGLNPSERTALGGAAITDEERDAMARTLAGEVDPRYSNFGTADFDRNAANILTSIENRYAAGSFLGANYSNRVDVVKQPKQYSTWNPGNTKVGDDNFNANPDYWRGVVDAFYSGAIKPDDPTITHYLNPKEASPSWAGAFNEVTSVGGHSFMSDPNLFGEAKARADKVYGAPNSFMTMENQYTEYAKAQSLAQSAQAQAEKSLARREVDSAMSSFANASTMPLSPFEAKPATFATAPTGEATAPNQSAAATSSPSAPTTQSETSAASDTYSSGAAPASPQTGAASTASSTTSTDQTDDENDA